MRLLYRLSRSLRRAVLKHLDRFRAGRVSARYAKRAELLHYRLPHPTVLCTMHSPHIIWPFILEMPLPARDSHTRVHHLSTVANN